uniref:Multidrug resistance-associated protein 4-like n=1 Tax=Diabrotica virgifera virgifera TaxID=50390 RepID=A0A6P7FQ01_DIAVI
MHVLWSIIAQEAEKGDSASWYVDSGASSHMVNYKGFYTQFDGSRNGVVSLEEKRQYSEVQGIVTGLIECVTGSGVENLKIDNVLWLVKLVKQGTKKQLEISDLYEPLDKDNSKTLGDCLERHWKNEILKSRIKKTSPSLLKAIVKAFYFEFLLYGIAWFVLNVLLRCSQPIILFHFIALFSGENREENQGDMYIYGGLLILVSVLSIFFMHHLQIGLASIGMRVRVACSSLVYRKITKLSHQSLGQTAVGQVVNLMSNDVHRFDLVLLPLHAFWAIPFQFVILSYFIWQQVQIASLAGLVSMVIISLPLQGNNITAEKVFSLAQAFNILQLSMAIWYPLAVSHGAEALISIKRLKAFLTLEEKEVSRIKGLSTPGVVMSNVSSSWCDAGETLQDISLNIPPGFLCVVIGPLGAGKSSLLQGKIDTVGTFEQLSRSKLDFAKIIVDSVEPGDKHEETTESSDLTNTVSNPRKASVTSTKFS